MTNYTHIDILKPGTRAYRANALRMKITPWLETYGRRSFDNRHHYLEANVEYFEIKYRKAAFIAKPGNGYYLVWHGYDLPYGLDIWDPGRKLLNFQWDSDGLLLMLNFKSGDWDARLSGYLPTLQP